MLASKNNPTIKERLINFLDMELQSSVVLAANLIKPKHIKIQQVINIQNNHIQVIYDKDKSTWIDINATPKLPTLRI